MASVTLLRCLQGVLELVLNKSVFNCYQVHLTKNHTFFLNLSYLRFTSQARKFSLLIPLIHTCSYLIYYTHRYKPFYSGNTVLPSWIMRKDQIYNVFSDDVQMSLDDAKRQILNSCNNQLHNFCHGLRIKNFKSPKKGAYW